MRMLIWISFVFFQTLLFAEEPWGIDSDLVRYKKKECFIPIKQSSSPLAQFGEKAIRFHQEVISPADGPRSHFIPSSSQYTLDAMRKYGFVKGFILGCDRLMRENDEAWVYRKTWDAGHRYLMKSDEVP